jgi:flavin reductase (DIM6/NTAB) family NADH-FMN oxidoreductase RutF
MRTTRPNVMSDSCQRADCSAGNVDPMTSTADSLHTAIEPAILYFGTPVVLISTDNEDGSANLAPMSSAFWLGWRAVLGLNARSKTTENLVRTREGVLNLPSDALAANVDRLALTTGSDPVPPVNVAECPVNLEAVVEDVRSLAADDDAQRGKILVFEMRILRVHVHDDIRMAATSDRIDPDAWRPLIMSFQQLYGLAGQPAVGQPRRSRYWCSPALLVTSVTAPALTPHLRRMARYRPSLMRRPSARAIVSRSWGSSLATPMPYGPGSYCAVDASW